MLDSGSEWHQALTDAVVFQTGQQLRELFVAMLLFCEVSDVSKLWDLHWKDLFDDIEYMQRKICSMPLLTLSDECKKSMAIYEIDLLLKKNGKSLEDFPGLPSVDKDLLAKCENRLLQEELSYDRTKLADECKNYISSLNLQQREVYNAVMEAIEDKNGGMLFVYGHGGTGKTFPLKTIVAKLRPGGIIVLAVASSELVVWDEAPMAHRHIFEAVDRTFHDILCKNDPTTSTKPFEGVTMLLGGDFRQVLPLMPNKGRHDIVMGSINKSPLWESCKVFKLHHNMRIEENVSSVTVDEVAVPFQDWVLRVGDGKVTYHDLINESDPSWIEIPKEILVKTNTDGVNTIINEIYRELSLNEDVEKLNQKILDLLPRELKIYRSSDTICKGPTNFEDQQVMYPPEFLNSIKFNGIPNHELQLKEGAPTMLLRNINPSKGMCNGTRLIITQLTRWVIEGKIITGNHIGKKVFIPRIIMSPSDSSLPFIFKRRQFPVTLCYAMTINKSQGQTVKNVGQYLKQPVFSHGQLYLAISRVISPTRLKIVIEEDDPRTVGFTKNVVYKEVFNNL